MYLILLGIFWWIMRGCGFCGGEVKLYRAVITHLSDAWCPYNFRYFFFCRVFLWLKAKISIRNLISTSWRERFDQSLTSHLMSGTLYERLQSSWHHLIRSDTGTTNNLLLIQFSLLYPLCRKRNSDVCICIFNWTLNCIVSSQQLKLC